MTRSEQTPLSFRVAFAAPSDELAPYLGGYHSFHTEIGEGIAHEEMVLPAWTNVQVQTSGGEWGIRIGQRTFDPLPRLMVAGPTSGAQFCRVITGHIIGVYLMPRGWARLVGGDASRWADRIDDMRLLLGRGEAEALGEAVCAADTLEGQVRPFEELFARRLAMSPPEPPEVATIEAMLLDPDVRTVEQLEAATGMPNWQLARFVRRNFGFTPKMLMRRARFIRTIVKIREAKGQNWALLVDEAYVDQSHFIRDCRDFLEMTPNQFAAKYQPVTHASMEERTRVLGDPHHVLQED
jgi:AraC-like DNA-binding protein